MALAIFDLDETLIEVDSSSEWFKYLVQEGIADESLLTEEETMMQAYHNGQLVMEDYMAFTLKPLQGKTVKEVSEWASRFIAEKIAPQVYPQALEALTRHRMQHDRILVISATGNHLVEPIARYLGIAESLSIELDTDNLRYTGQTKGVLTYQEGKVIRLNQWMAEHGCTLDNSHGYSDSQNDVPLLEAVTHAHVINASPHLRHIAKQKGWQEHRWYL